MVRKAVSYAKLKRVRIRKKAKKTPASTKNYSCTIIIEGADAKIDGTFPLKTVQKVTSYYQEGYRFTDAYRNRVWDGKIKLFKKATKTFPAGLVTAVLEALKKDGVKVQVDDQRSRPVSAHQEAYKADLVKGVSFDYPFDFQPKCAEAMVEAQRGVISLATNSGKTTVAALVTRMIALPTLFLVPGKELLYQTQKVFLERLGVSENMVGIIGDGHWKPGQLVTVATVGTMHSRLDGANCQKLLQDIDVFFADECFVAGTIVGGVPIEQIKEGDRVWSFDEKTEKFGYRTVTRKFVNKPSAKLLTISFSDRNLTCTPGHPFWTHRGWVQAWALQSTDMVLCTMPKQEVKSEKKEDQDAMYRVRKRSRAVWESRIRTGSAWSRLLLKCLQEILDVKKIIRSDDSNKPIQTKSDLQKNEEEQPHAHAWREGKDENDSQGNGMETPSTRWKRAWSICSSIIARQFAWVGDGSSYPYQEEERVWVSDSLQNRYCQQSTKSSNRSRRRKSLRTGTSEARSKEGPALKWLRVEGVEVHQQTSDGTFGGVCKDGLVYNLEVEGTHTYLANGAVVHNCHHTAADSWYEVIRSCDAYYRFGMSGTPLKRSDGADLKLVAATGPVCYTVRNKDLVERKISVQPVIQFIEIKKPEIPAGAHWKEVYSKGIVGNPYRNRELCLKAAEFVDQGLSVLMLVNEIKHGEVLDKKLWDLPRGSFNTHQFINGTESSEVRKKALDDFRKGDLKILIATSILNEGVDIPNIDVLVLAAGGKSTINTLQRVGRGLRIGGNIDKLYVVDTADYTHKYLLKHSMQRLKDYRAEQCFQIEEVG